ncbi:uncharacterized protein LOC143706708 [Siphateles boraxobius]|uniref:uncharacterized protein LOC143706708 n=1 Tax=Siphateles boraxobius TaxID=180520 RepID=UPI0040630386
MRMSVRMAPPLSVIFLLMIHGVSSGDWGVSYSPSHICALKDSTVIVACTYTYPTGYQIMKAFWTKGSADSVHPPDLSNDPEYSQRLQYLGDKQQNCTVILSHVTRKDSHMYYFRFITNITEGRWIGYPGVSLTVTDLQVESPERVTEGDSVSLTCKSSCALTDRATFIWYRNSQKILTEIKVSNKLSLNPVRREDSGRYRCAVDGHTHISPDVQINVMYPPQHTFVGVSPCCAIVEGDSVTLTCISDSNPPALNFSWFKGGTIVGSGRIYNISKISSDDSGEYKCKSIYEHGEKYSDAVTLNIMYPPRNVSVSISPSGVIVEGDSVTLNCISDSNPPALNFSWFKENETSAVGSGQSFSALQSGRFYCQAHNQHGSQRSDAVTVTVHHVAGRNVIVITAASGGLFIIIIFIIIILFILKKRRSVKAEDHTVKENDLYSDTSQRVSVHDKPLSEPDSVDDALYASVKPKKLRGKTPESRDAEEILYTTVQHHRKTETKSAEENESHYDDIRVHQPDDAVSTNLTSTNLTSTSLTSTSLTSTNLTSTSLTSTSLTSTSLTSTNLTSTSLTNTSLTSTNLTSTSLTSTSLTSTSLTSTSLTSTSLTSSNLTSTSLTSTNLTSTNLTSISLTSTSLTSSILTITRLTSTNLTSTILTSISLTSTRLTHTTLTSTSLTSTSLTTTNLTSTNLTSTSLTSTSLTSTNLTSTSLTRTSLTSTSLTSTSLTSTSLTSSNLTSTSLTSTNLTSTNLTSTSLTSSNLTSTSLTSSNLSSTSLTSTSLTSTNLTSTSLTSTCYISCNIVVLLQEDEDRSSLENSKFTLNTPDGQWQTQLNITVIGQGVKEREFVASGVIGIMKVFWTKGSVDSVHPPDPSKTKDKKDNEEFPDLSNDTEYSQRLQYLGDKQQNCTVRLSHVTLKDSHMYYFRFITDKPGGKWTGEPGVTLTVTGDFDLQVESPERVTEGDSVSLTCKSSCTLTDRATFIWYRNSQKILTEIKVSNKLSLNPVRREDSGRYRCAVDGHTHISPDVQINVMYPPVKPVISISPSGVIVEGDSVTLNCISDSNPPALNFSWFKGGTIVGSGRIYSISKISSDDSGEYKCKSINEHGEKYSDTVTLNVMFPPRSVSVLINGSGVIVEGDSVTLKCISDSNPPALNFSWFKENETSAVGSGQSFSALQSGRFYCQAHNQHGSQRSDAVTVTVHHVAGRNVIVITAASGGLFIIIIFIIFILFILKKRRSVKAEDHTVKENDLYSDTSQRVSVHDKPLSEPDSVDDALYASVKPKKLRGKTPESRDAEEILYTTVQHHIKTETKRAEENESHYDDIRVHQPDDAVRRSTVQIVEDASVIYSSIK